MTDKWSQIFINSIVFTASVIIMSDGLEKIVEAKRLHFKSEGERKIAHFLDNNNIRYQYEPGVLINGQYDKPRIWYIDFKLPEYASFIEYFGLAGRPDYNEGIKAKMAAYKKMEMDVIAIYPSMFRGNWQRYIMDELDSINQRRYDSLRSKRYWSRPSQEGGPKEHNIVARPYGFQQMDLFQKGSYR